MRRGIVFWLLLTISPISYGQDLDVIRQIENNLLPSKILPGENQEGRNLYERMIEFKVPAVSIAFFDRGEIQWTRCYGYRDLEGMKHVDPETVFQAASISKPVAAFGMLKLVQDGIFDLDRDVNEYLKDWEVSENGLAADEKVTLRRLLTHTAGLTVHGFRGYASDEAVPEVIQILDGMTPANSAKIELDTFPGSIWRYSGGGYTVMQKLVEDHQQAPLESFMEPVLSAIDMNRSTYAQPLPEDWQGNAAAGYRSNGNQVQGRFHTYPEKAAAGLWTTPSDLARFAIEIQQSYRGASNRVLSQESVRDMLTKHQNDWGLGPSLSGEGDHFRFGHGGSNEGFRCQLVAYLNGPGVAIMTNSDNGSRLIAEILRSISKVYDWPDFKPEIIELAPVGITQLKILEGNYESDGFELKIVAEDGHLALTQLWDNISYPLYHLDEMVFIELEEGYRFRFNLDDTGKVENLVYAGRITLMPKKD